MLPSGPTRTDAVALAAVFDLPSLAQSRARVIALAESSNGSRAPLTAALECDPALVLAVLRETRTAVSHSVASIPAALDVLSGERIASIARRVPVYDLFTNGTSGHPTPDVFHLHARGVQRVAGELARETGHGSRDELVTAALLHDVGKLVLECDDAAVAQRARASNATPEERVRDECREFGESHAAVGARVLAALGLPPTLTRVVDAHHSPGAEDAAALVRLADMLTHYRAGRRISFDELTSTAASVGLDRDRLGALIYELTEPVGRRGSTECPLSERELEVLRWLARGRLYKEIAGELGVSPSTVRNHLHHVYRKLGSRDRAQAVLLASERGWL
ncbi:MAG: HDOD domain-containing protein [Thermoleophilaceae bacterium]